MITYILLTVIPVTILGYISYQQYTKSIENEVGSYIPKLLEQANYNINNQMEEFKKLPDALYSSQEVIRVLRKDSYQQNSALLQDQFIVNRFLSENYVHSSNSDDVLGVFVLSKGRLFKSTKRDYVGFETKDFPEPYGSNMDLQGQVEIILPHETNLEFEGNPPFVMFEKQIRDYDNQEDLGVIFIAIELTFLDESLMSLREEQDSNVWITDRRGRIVYHTNSNLIGGIDQNFNEYPDINGSFRTLEENNNELISRNKLPIFEWNLFHSVPLKQLTAETNAVKQGTIIAFIILVTLSIAISILLAWNVSNPLHKLTKLMKKVERGNFDVDLPTTKNNDEIGLLANSFNSMIQKVNQLIKENYEIEIKQKDAELYALQSQINPHFMYNTLETIGYAVEEEDKEVVSKMVTLLGRMLRYSLSNKDRFVPISQEIMHINDFLTIQKFRFEEKVHFHINSDLDTNKYFMTKFILQPIVENAIKYGLEQSKPTSVEVTLKKTDDEDIEIRIKDNGPGIEPSLLSNIKQSLKENPIGRRDSSFGLINVNARINMIYGNDYGLDVQSKRNIGTEVTIKIPAITEQDISQKMEGVE